jgi:GrpB-like predicted nucleotidyltransferase (UPF0157 family)
MDEEPLARITIGDLRPLDGPVTLVEYDPGWPARYADLAAAIRSALGCAALRVEHVGSTSVPGLVAKPIIDVVLAVDDSAREDAYVPALEALGYRLRIREPDWYEHRLLRLPDVNLHVFSAGSPEIERMLAFRDRLRAEPAERARYEAVKRELAARRWRHVQDYADAKTHVVEGILGRVTPPRGSSPAAR